MPLQIKTRPIARTALAGVAAAAMLTLASAEETYITGVHNPSVLPPEPEPPRYMLMDLGTLGGAQSRALGMNDQATVVGWSDTGPQPYAFARQAFIRRLNEPMTALPSLGWGDTEARAINAFEQVVGVAIINEEPHGIYWNDGVPFALDDVTNIYRGPTEGAAVVDTQACHAPLRHVIEANSINDWGEIAACGLFLGDDNVHGILLTPHEPFNPIEPFFDWVDLGELPGAEDCIAYAVNACCEVVGVSGDDAFVWGGGIQRLDNPKLVSEARSINNWGTAVGWTGEDAGHPMAAMWEGGHRFDLCPDPGTVSQANAIADNGQVVGWTAPYSPFWPYQVRPRYAMLWEGCIPVFLNAETMFPGQRQWRLEQATAVDRMGYVAGFGIAPDGSQRAYLLVPWEFIPGTDLR